MPQLKSVRPLDAAIAAIAAVVLVLAVYLGYSLWAQQSSVASSTPAARAVATLEARVRKEPNSLDLRMELAQSLAVAGRDRQSEEQYRAALKIAKDFTPALSGLGFLALKQKEFATGEGYYRKMADILETKQSSGRDPQLEIAYFYLGTALMEQRKYEEAANYFKKALAIRRDASDTHYALAVTYGRLGLDDKYRQELETTLLFDPKMPEPNYDYAVLLLKDGDKAGAAEHLRTSITGAPRVDKPAKMLEELGPFEDRFASAQKLAPTDAAAALSEARIAVALEPRDVEALLLAADLYMKAGDKVQSPLLFQRVLDIEPDNAVAIAGLKQVTDAK